MTTPTLVQIETAPKTEKMTDVQGSYLNELKDEQAECFVYLVNGIKLMGRIVSFDPYVMILDGGKMGRQMVYKSAISTVLRASSAR